MDIRNALSKSNDILIAFNGSRATAFNDWHPLLFRTAACIRPATIQKGDAGLAVLPEPPFQVLTPPDHPAPELNGLYTSGQISQFPLRPGEGSYTIYTFNHRLEW